MKMNFLKYSALILGLFLILTSCQEDGGLPGTDATVSQTSSTLVKARAMNASANSQTEEGDNDCFKFNYPLTIILTDGSSKTVNSDEELDKAFSDDTFDFSFKLKYPITVTINGASKTVNSDAELDAVLESCDNVITLEEGLSLDTSLYAECFTVKYPTTIKLPNGETIKVESQEEEMTKILEYYEANPDAEGEVEFVYPVTLIVDGSSKVINSAAELDAILEACHISNDQKIDTEGVTEGKECFTVKYPATIKLPNGETVKVESQEEEMTKVGEFYDANPNAEGEVELVYPVTIVKTDGAELVVNSAEDLEKLFVSCYGGADLGE